MDANGNGSRHGESIHVDLWAMPGEFDEQLNWPVIQIIVIMYTGDCAEPF